MTADAPAIQPRGDESGLAGMPIVSQEGHVARGISNPILGMLLFITSEVMFFSGLFAAYFSTRARDLSSDPWKAGQQILNDALPSLDHPLSLIVIATILLIASSFTCQFAVWAIRRGDRTGFLRNIGFTFILGIAFLIMQAIDYSVLFGKGLSLSSSMFGTTYFTLTGFHGAHVFGGVLMLGVILYRGMAGQFSARHHDAVEAVSFYWHFVDVVWIILFSTLYLL
ncbi:MAG TPA: cytochrome c oxidase subunit 3 [Candidatus Limnocylindrales bacterium]|nr:cytochrome c oxidase subunit 3 [Candidatus Limnocylindrales bacterium]